jgi:tight adherence protein B
MVGIAALLIFVAAVLAGYGVSAAFREREEARRVLAGRLRGMGDPVVEAQAAPLLKDQRLSTIPLLNVLLNGMPAVVPVVRMIRQAGLRRRVGEVLLYIPLLACIGFLATVLAGGGPLLGLVVAVAGGSLPLLVVQRIRRQRTARFGEQLPDALDLVRSALQAGHGLLSALSVVADAFLDPIAQDLRHVVEEVRLGLPLREALANLVERVDDPNVPILVVGILVAQDVGGNLAEVIDNIAYTIRERAKVLREVNALTAQGRLSGGVLTALPFVVGLVMYVFKRVPGAAARDDAGPLADRVRPRQRHARAPDDPPHRAAPGVRRGGRCHC